MVAVDGETDVRYLHLRHFTDNHQGFLPYHHLDQFFSRTCKKPLYRPPGNTHHLSGPILVEILAVAEVEHLQLITLQRNNLQFPERLAGRVEDTTHIFS